MCACVCIGGGECVRVCRRRGVCVCVGGWVVVCVWGGGG